MRRLVFILLFTSVFSVSAYSSLIPLGQIAYEHGYSASYSRIEEIQFGLGNILLEQAIYSEPLNLNDIEKGIILNTNAPNYDFIASLLTSGSDNIIMVGAQFPQGGGVGYGGYESELLEKFIETDAADFYGYEIEEIALIINELTFDYTFDAQAGHGWQTDVAYDITFTFYGQAIPEPTTLLLLGLGALVGSARYRKNAK